MNIDTENVILPARIYSILDDIERGQEIMTLPGILGDGWYISGVRMPLALLLWLSRHRQIEPTYREFTYMWRKAVRSGR